MRKPAFTWTPVAEPGSRLEHLDRIDFIFVRGPVTVERAAIVEEKHPEADIVVTPWPSDHRAVMAVVRID